jgi:hypothetical protein
MMSDHRDPVSERLEAARERLRSASETPEGSSLADELALLGAEAARDQARALRELTTTVDKIGRALVDRALHLERELAETRDVQAAAVKQLHEIARVLYQKGGQR